MDGPPSPQVSGREWAPVNPLLHSPPPPPLPFPYLLFTHPLEPPSPGDRGVIKCVLPVDADCGRAPWQLGQRTYGFLPDSCVAVIAVDSAGEADVIIVPPLPDITTEPRRLRKVANGVMARVCGGGLECTLACV